MYIDTLSHTGKYVYYFYHVRNSTHLKWHPLAYIGFQTSMDPSGVTKPRPTQAQARATLLK